MIDPFNLAQGKPPGPPGIFNRVTGAVGGALKNTGTVVAGAAKAVAAFGANPSLDRLVNAGATIGGFKSPAQFSRVEPTVTFGNGRFTPYSGQADWRVKVCLPPGSPIFGEAFAPGAACELLSAEKGVVFPHTPVVNLSHTAKYETQSLVHSNYNFYNYTGSETGAISITADFTVQSIEEAKYLIGAVYFFRACTKMFYGAGAYVGNPPPIVFLSGYGKVLLPRTPCVVTGFTHNLPNDVDYLVDGVGPVSTADTTWVPTHSQLSITVQPVVSRNKQSAFDLNSFAAGHLLNIGGIGGSRGGFL
jgi:hypothetical protein